MAALSFASSFGDHAVLQQAPAQAVVWGFAPAALGVTLTLAGGGLSSKLSEGDVIAVFSQVGEIEEMNFQRDARTGKPKGFAFIKFEDARSSILAIDNFNSFKLLGRHLHVDHAVNPRSGSTSSK